MFLHQNVEFRVWLPLAYQTVAQMGARSPIRLLRAAQREPD